MRPRSAFARSLLFAVLAGLGAAPFLLVAAPLFAAPFDSTSLGAGRALVLYGWLCVLGYLGFSAPSLRRGFVAVAVAAALAPLLALATAGGGVWAGLVAAAMLLAAGRGVLLASLPPARSVAAEAILVGGGLLLARLLGGPSLLGVALGVWTFFLVQCLHPLLGGERRAPEEALDPFEKARRELERILGEA
jgi:hypothetical protein